MGSYLSRQIYSIQHALSCIDKLPVETQDTKPVTDNTIPLKKEAIDINEYTELFKELR
jgi:hypothetical protein